MKSAVVRVSPPSETAESSDDLEETPQLDLASNSSRKRPLPSAEYSWKDWRPQPGAPGMSSLSSPEMPSAPSSLDASPANPNQSPGAAARRCGVHFGGVQVFHHRLSLDDSKLPSDGLAPVGLGPLQRSEVRRLNSYEADRERCRQGVGLIPPDRRREAIIGSSSSGIKRKDNLERIERTNRELKRSQQDSILDHLNALRRQHGGTAGGGSAEPRRFTVFDRPADDGAGDGDEESEEEMVAAAAVEEGGEADEDDDDDDDDDDSDDEEVEEVVEEGAAEFFGEHLGGWQPAG